MNDTLTDPEALRARHQLRLLEVEHEGVPVSLLPNGVYGFAHAPGIREFPLFQKKLSQAFETHKLADGSVHLVGFVSARAAEQLASGRESSELDLYPDAWEDATQVACVALARVSQARPPSRDNGNYVRLRLEQLQ